MYVYLYLYLCIFIYIHVIPGHAPAPKKSHEDPELSGKSFMLHRGGTRWAQAISATKRVAEDAQALAPAGVASEETAGMAKGAPNGLG